MFCVISPRFCKFKCIWHLASGPSRTSREKSMKLFALSIISPFNTCISWATTYFRWCNRSCLFSVIVVNSNVSVCLSHPARHPCVTSSYNYLFSPLRLLVRSIDKSTRKYGAEMEWHDIIKAIKFVPMISCFW